MTGDITKGSTGPVATSSKLGWLLSGNSAASSTDTFCNNVNSVLIIDTVPMKNQNFRREFGDQRYVEGILETLNCGAYRDLDDKASNENL